MLPHFAHCKWHLGTGEFYYWLDSGHGKLLSHVPLGTPADGPESTSALLAAGFPPDARLGALPMAPSATAVAQKLKSNLGPEVKNTFVSGVVKDIAALRGGRFTPYSYINHDRHRPL